MKFRHSISTKWRGKKMLLKVNPDRTNVSAFVDCGDGVIWCNPRLWEYLCQIDDIILDAQEQVAEKGGANA